MLNPISQMHVSTDPQTNLTASGASVLANASQPEERPMPLHHRAHAPSGPSVLAVHTEPVSAPIGRGLGAGLGSDTSGVVSILNAFTQLTPAQRQALLPMLNNLATPQDSARLASENTGYARPPSYASDD